MARKRSATFADAHSDHLQALRSIPILLLARQGLLFLRAPHALRWRLETFGLYMPSYPEARPWWRVNRRALAAFVRQLPRYTRWLAGMRALRHDGAHGYWVARSGTGAREWGAWLDLAEGDDSSEKRGAGAKPPK